MRAAALIGQDHRGRAARPRPIPASASSTVVAFPPSATPPPWANQPITLYHGTVDVHVPSILAGVNVGAGRARADFGTGFYTSTIDRQALSWAWQLSGRHSGALPAVIRFDVDRDALAALDSVWFVRGGFDADDFWSLVFRCRQGADHGRGVNGGWYDVAVGPVTASWRQRSALADADQISFHTARAAAILDMSSPRRVV